MGDAKRVGCSDHGCVFGHPGGMGTNGGCRCLDDVRRACGVKAYVKLRDAIAVQATTLAELREENVRLRGLLREVRNLDELGWVCCCAEHPTSAEGYTCLMHRIDADLASREEGEERR